VGIRRSLHNLLECGVFFNSRSGQAQVANGFGALEKNQKLLTC